MAKIAIYKKFGMQLRVQFLFRLTAHNRTLVSLNKNNKHYLFTYTESS